MEGYRTLFEGKKITVLGLGILGRGVGDVQFLARCGAEIIITDIKDKAELAESVAQLSHYPNVTFHLGGHQKEDFEHCDMVLKAAGVRLDSPEIAAARAAHIPVVMSTALFAKYAMDTGAKIIGVTGTRGKSTVAHLIFHTLQKAGRRSLLGGNIRGISTLAMLPDVQKDDIAVLELDSWQLQGFGELQISPHIAVMTNLMQDHQNYYPDMDTYFADKANIFRFQHQGDALICGWGIAQRVSDAKSPIAPMTPLPLPDNWHLNILGEHNRENAALAAAALKAVGLSESDIRGGLESFEGVEGRLQFVREINGVKIYNDNNATTPEATVAALRALAAGRTKPPVVLIMGGADKGLDIQELGSAIRAYCKKVVLLAGTGTDKVQQEVREAPMFDSLEKALATALATASAGDTILFSPAFASFGMFKNEYDRNDQFMTLVASL